MITFNAPKFFEHLDAIRQHRGMTWADVSRDTNVPTKTITGLEHNSKPNADNLAALIHWSNNTFETFIKEEPTATPLLTGPVAQSFEQQDILEDAAQ